VKCSDSCNIFNILTLSASTSKHTLSTFLLEMSSSSSSGQQLINSIWIGDIASVRKLLDEGVDVNWKNGNGWTALMYASIQGHVEGFKLLLDRGAQIDIKNNDGSSALIIASYNGRFECVRLLLERGADMSIRNKDGETAKDRAVDLGHVEIVQLLDEVRRFQTHDQLLKYCHSYLI
jgi:ankyrin repeat protein